MVCRQPGATGAVRATRMSEERTGESKRTEAVEFVDAGGLRVLLHAAQRARKRGAHLALKEPGALLRRLLNLTGLDRTIVVLPPGSP